MNPLQHYLKEFKGNTNGYRDKYTTAASHQKPGQATASHNNPNTIQNRMKQHSIEEHTQRTQSARRAPEEQRGKKDKTKPATSDPMGKKSSSNSK